MSPTATAWLTPTATERQSTTADGGTNTVAVTYSDDSDLPEVCRGDVVPNIFKDFVRYYNEADLEGVMGLIQEDIPGWPHSDGWEMVVHNGDGEVEFKWVAMNAGKPYGFMATTPNELRTQLSERIAVGEQFEIKSVSVGAAIAQSWSEAESGRPRGSWTSERIANFSLHFETYVDGQLWSPGDAKGVVDCVTGKIIMLNLGVTPPPGIRPVEGAPTVTFETASESGKSSAAVEFQLAADLPEVCRNDAVPNLFNEFVRRYNAGDVDGVMEMIQQDVPDWEYSNGWELVAYDADGMVEFKFFAVGTGLGQESAFMATTPDELRTQLAARMANGEQLQINGITVAPSTTLAAPNPKVDRSEPYWISERNADFRLDFMRTIEDDLWTHSSANGTVDCKSGKIVLWASS